MTWALKLLFGKRNFGPILAVLVVFAAFGWLYTSNQTKTATIADLQADIRTLQANIAACDKRIATIKKDQADDNEIESLSDTDLRARAIRLLTDTGPTPQAAP